MMNGVLIALRGEPMSSAAAISVASPITLLTRRWGHHRQGVSTLVHCFAPRKCHIRAAMAASNDPNKLRAAPGALKETVLKVVPELLRHLPWEKAEGVPINKAVFIGRKALKWVYIALLVTSSLSDFLFAISRSRELLAPLGLLVGCLLTDFLKEVAMEYSRDSRDAYLLNYLVSIGCFFTVLKLTSAYCALGARVFLLHVANGGFMQILWLWRTTTSQTKPDSIAEKQLV